jgi:hypothetical protein
MEAKKKCRDTKLWPVFFGGCITTMSLLGTLKGRGDNPKNNISLVDCKG